MGVEASQIRILHKILMKNSYVPASVYFCPGCLLKSLILLGLHVKGRFLVDISYR